MLVKSINSARSIGQSSSSEILTPEKEKKENASAKLWVYTKKYGETLSTLKPGFEDEAAEKIQGEYKIEVPRAVTNMCKEIRSLGGRALLVGGSVRDAVISQELEDFDLEPKDFDLEVYGLEPETLDLVLHENFKEVKTEGKAFAVLKVSVEELKEHLDISIPRRESKTGEGHKGFTIEGDPTMNISEAALRRDLTINSLAYDPLNETLYNSYNGVEHIRQRKIEVTDEQVFQEDPLRVLRIMQFASRFEFEVSETTSVLCKEMVWRGDLDTLPSERVTEELRKLFEKGRKPSIGLNFALEVGIVERYWPEVHALVGIPQERDWHPEGDVWTHTLQTVNAAALIADRENLSDEDRLVLGLAALTHDFGKPATAVFKDGHWRSHGHEAAGVEPAERFLNRFNFSKNVKSKVLAFIPDHLAPKYFWDQEVKHGTYMRRAVNRLADRLGKAGTDIYKLSLLAEADQRGRNPDPEGTLNPLSRGEVSELDEWQTWLKEKAEKLEVMRNAPKQLLYGRDLLEALSLDKGGIWVGCVLKAVRGDQLDAQITSSEEALEKGLHYNKLFGEIVQEVADQEGMKEEEVWSRLDSYGDPRVVLAHGLN